ncbi:hypothetical protein GW17_00003729, partial [Ensete ventricosum]
CFSFSEASAANVTALLPIFSLPRPPRPLIPTLASLPLSFPLRQTPLRHLLRGASPRGSSSMSRQPEVLWAQRSDKVYLTVSLPDARDVSVESEPQGAFRFSAVGAHGERFDFSLELYDSIASKTNIGMRNIICSIKKERKGWWKRLQKSEEKPAPYIKVDWNKWCDEDDEESDIGKYISEEVKN